MSQIRANSIVPSGGVPSGATGGGIVQVVQSFRTSLISTTSSSYQTILSASITPRSSSNKILICCSGRDGGYQGDNNNYVRHTIKRGSTEIYLGDASGSAGRGSSGQHNLDGNAHTQCVNIQYVDSPGTTSATTYSWQFLNPRGGNWAVFCGGAIRNTFLGDTRVPSNLILMEVSG